MVFFSSAIQDATRIVTQLQGSAVTGAVMRQCNALAGTLLEMIRDSALWPPLNSFQTTVIEDDDEYDTPTPREHPAPSPPTGDSVTFFRGLLRELRARRSALTHATPLPGGCAREPIHYREPVYT
jgi:hypothetical protein